MRSTTAVPAMPEPGMTGSRGSANGALALILSLVSAFGLTSCRSAPTELPPASVPSAALPSLEEVSLDGIVDTLMLSPLNLAVTAEGTVSLWVKNGGSGQIITLDSSGALVSSWGRVGEGPGEVRSADLLLSGDSTVTLAGLSGQPVRVFKPDGSLLIQKPRPPVGLPSAPAAGRMIWWTARHVGKGPRDQHPTVERDGPVVLWCIVGDCSDEILGSDDSIVKIVNEDAAPRGVGLWPAFASRGDVVVVGDGYSYRLWEIDLRDPDRVMEFGRTLPPRIATDSQIAVAESGWARLERGVPGPGGEVIRDNFDRERRFIRTVSYPHFQFLGMGFDGNGRLWVNGRDSTAAMFLDVFADTTFLGRISVGCNRSRYAAAVRGHWFAAICVVGGGSDDRFRVRLFRIVEPQSGG